MWIEKWKRNGVLNYSWSRFIKPSKSTPGKMYGLVKTHKEGNPVRVITSGCGTAIENLSIFIVNYRKDKANINSLETLIELVEDDIFKPDNYRQIKSNITKEEREGLKNIQRDSTRSNRIQDKGSRFVILDNDDYIEKIDYQLRSSFSELNYDPL